MFNKINIKLKGGNKKMKERKMEIKNKKGITLIALIITIIVLLILARCVVECDSGRKWYSYNGDRSQDNVEIFSI